MNLDALLAAALDAVRVEAIVAAVVARCGGPGSGVPGPCPEGGRPAPSAGRRRPVGRPGGGTPPPRRPAPPGGGGGGGSGGGGGGHDPHRAALVEHHLRLIDDGLAGAGLPKAQAKHYRSQARRVINATTTEGLRHLRDNVTAYHFHPDRAALQHEAVGRGVPNPSRWWAFYDENDGTLHLDGGGTGEDAARVVYAHEHAHAIDGPARQFSGTPGWQAAWQAEIVSDPDYPEIARREPHEGWSYFGELLLSRPGRRATIRGRYPNCTAYWEGQNL